MQAEISKWGNSMALRIPAAMVKELGLTKGAKANITIEDGRLIVVPSKKMSRQERLQWLLADLQTHGPIEEIPSGPAQGNEIVEW